MTPPGLFVDTSITTNLKYAHNTVHVIYENLSINN